MAKSKLYIYKKSNKGLVEIIKGESDSQVLDTALKMECVISQECGYSDHRDFGELNQRVDIEHSAKIELRRLIEDLDAVTFEDIETLTGLVPNQTHNQEDSEYIDPHYSSDLRSVSIGSRVYTECTFTDARVFAKWIVGYELTKRDLKTITPHLISDVVRGALENENQYEGHKIVFSSYSAARELSAFERKELIMDGLSPSIYANESTRVVYEV